MNNIIKKQFKINIKGIESDLTFCFDGDRSDPIHYYLNSGHLLGQDLIQISQLFWKTSNLIILDIGAHIGTYSLQAANYTYNKVIAIEASPENFKYLQRNKELNAAKNLEIYNFAAARHLGQLKFSGAGSGAHIADEGEIVTAMPLDDLLVNETQLDFIKLDIEGYEIEAIHGMNKTLQKFMPPVLFEINGHTLNFFDKTPNDLLNVFTKLGYVNYLIYQQFVPVDSNAPFPLGVCDCLAVPPDKIKYLAGKTREPFSSQEIAELFKLTEERGNEDIKNYLKIYHQKLKTPAL